MLIFPFTSRSIICEHNLFFLAPTFLTNLLHFIHRQYSLDRTPMRIPPFRLAWPFLYSSTPEAFNSKHIFHSRHGTAKLDEWMPAFPLLAWDLFPETPLLASSEFFCVCDSVPLPIMWFVFLKVSGGCKFGFFTPPPFCGCLPPPPLL